MEHDTQGIIYPSIAADLNSVNICLLPGASDKSLEFKEISITSSKCSESNGKMIRTESVCHFIGKAHTEENIVWMHPNFENSLILKDSMEAEAFYSKA